MEWNSSEREVSQSACLFVVQNAHDVHEQVYTGKYSVLCTYIYIIPMAGNICRIDGYLVATNKLKEIIINKLSITRAFLVPDLYLSACLENTNATMSGGIKNSQDQCISINNWPKKSAILGVDPPRPCDAPSATYRNSNPMCERKCEGLAICAGLTKK